MDLNRVNEIEHQIAQNKLSAVQVFTQMKKLIYREPPCYAFCEKKSYESKIRKLEIIIEKTGLTNKEG